MSTIYDQILDDLLETTPENVTPPILQMDTAQTPDLQVMHHYRRLQRATRFKDRHMTLVHAYRLGELLDHVVNRHQYGYLANMISKYYHMACIRTYQLFEHSGVEQILRTKKVTLKMITRLKSAEFKTLVQG